MPSTTITGGCLCGGVRYLANALPRSSHYCHCSMCRRATGGVFAVLVWFERDAIRWTGEAPVLADRRARFLRRVRLAALPAI